MITTRYENDLFISEEIFYIVSLSGDLRKDGWVICEPQYHWHLCVAASLAVLAVAVEQSGSIVL